MVILGAGVIGCEYTTIFSNFKRTQVYLIDKADRILPFEDADISELVSQRMSRKGVTVHHKANLKYMKKVNGKIEYCIEHPVTKETEVRTVDIALLSIGREPNLAGLNLEAAGVTLNERGTIHQPSPGTTATSQDHIKVVGDSSPGISLVNVAELEARSAAENLFAEKSMTNGTRTSDNLSSIMFLDPKVAAIGLNELQLHEKKIEYKIAVFHYSLIGRAIAKGKPTGFIKIMVTNDEDMKILGVRALGQHSSTVVDLVSYLIKKKAPIREVAELISGYPSISEAFFECARLLTESSILKPKSFPHQTRLAKCTYGEDGKPQYSSLIIPGIVGISF